MSRAIRTVFVFSISCLFFSEITNAQLVINELSQGPSGSKEYVELLVVGNPTCDSNCVDIRGWIIDDNNGTFAAGSGRGIAQGCMRFANDPQWQCVPMGTIIVVYNFGDRNAALPPDDPTDANGDCVYVIPEWSSLFDGNTSQPNTTNPSYTGVTFTPGGNWSSQSMNNGGDSYQTRSPNNIGVPHHAVSWGNNSNNNVIYFAGSAGQTTFFMSNAISNDPFVQANWSSGSNPGAETPGAPNNPANAAWISTMNNNCQPFVGGDSTGILANICQGDSLFAGGAWQFTPGTYTDTFIAGGCDSIVYTFLSVDSAYNMNRSVSICQGDSFFAQGAWQTSTGVYTDLLNTVNGCDSNIITNLTVISIINDSQTFDICPGDSVLIFGNFETAQGAYLDTIPSSSGPCDSIRRFYIINWLPTPGSSQNSSICLGDSILIGGAYRSVAGLYFDTAIAANGCDSIIQVNLSVVTPIYDTTQISACQGDTIPVFGNLVTLPGFYFDTLFSSSGCDSAINVADVTFIPSTLDSISVSICTGDSILINGNWETSSGIYIDSLLSVNNCDSLIRIDLNVGSFSSGFTSVSICQGDSIFAGGAWQTTTGNYNDTILTGGCDSIHTTQLTVNSPSFNPISIGICQGDSIFLQGAWQTSPGVFFDTLTNTLSCDSVIETTLSVINPVVTQRALAICTGDSIFLGGSWRFNPGNYFDTLSSFSTGCDSIIESQLTVLQTLRDTASNSICQGDSIFLGGSWRSTSGIYHDTLISSSGCDSIQSTGLTVIAPVNTQSSISICQGDSVFAGGAWQFSSGSYFDTLISFSTACDSIHETQLSVNPIQNSNSNLSICAGDSAFLGGAWQTVSGNFFDTIPSAVTGCDSIHETQLTVIQPVQGNDNQSICDGDSIFLAGGWQQTSGLYYDTLTSSLGCDSILETTLTVINPVNGQANIEICDGDSYFAGGGFQTTSGVYFDTLIAASGCDSIHRSDLSVLQNPVVFPGSPNRSICEGDSLFIQGPNFPPNLSYQWSTGATTRSIWVSPTVSTTYTLTVTDASGCEGSGNIAVSPFSFNVTANATPDTVLFGEDAQLAAGGDPAASYEWRPFDFLDDAFSANSNAIGMTQTTTYTLSATSDSGCVDSDSVTVFVIQPDQVFLLPTGFSPNGDGINEIFRVLNTDLWEITVFQVWNRWGDLIYDQNRDNPNGWDGNFKNKKQPIGTYAFYVQGFSTISGQQHQSSGTITLVR